MESAEVTATAEAAGREREIPVEGERRHAAAVVAQTGVHPGLGEDDVDLVLLRRRKQSRGDTFKSGGA